MIPIGLVEVDWYWREHEQMLDRLQEVLDKSTKEEKTAIELLYGTLDFKKITANMTGSEAREFADLLTRRSDGG